MTQLEAFNCISVDTSGILLLSLYQVEYLLSLMCRALGERQGTSPKANISSQSW